MNEQQETPSLTQLIKFYWPIFRKAVGQTSAKRISGTAVLSVIAALAYTAVKHWEDPDRNSTFIAEFVSKLWVGCAVFVGLLVFNFFKVTYQESQHQKKQLDELPEHLLIVFNSECITENEDYHTIFHVYVVNTTSTTQTSVQAFCENLEYTGNGDADEAKIHLQRFRGPVPLSTADEVGVKNPPKKFEIVPGATKKFDVIKLNRATGKLHLCHEKSEWRNASDVTPQRGEVNIRGRLYRILDDTLAFGDYDLDVVVYADNCKPVKKSFRLHANARGNKSITVKELRTPRSTKGLHT